MYRVNELDEPIKTLSRFKKNHLRIRYAYATIHHISKPTSNNLRGINIDANAPESAIIPLQ